MSKVAVIDKSTTIAFTAGVGIPFADMAQRAARRFEMLNEIEVRVLSKDSFPFHRLLAPTWVKAFLWDLTPSYVNHIIWLDADIVPVHALNEIPAVAFAAVPDMPAMSDIAPFVWEGKRFEPYFNAGFFVAGRESIPAFNALARDMILQGNYDDRFEQSLFNIRVRSFLGGFYGLPLSWNWFFKFYDEIVGKPLESPRMVHFIHRLFDDRFKAIKQFESSLEIPVFT